MSYPRESERFIHCNDNTDLIFTLCYTDVDLNPWHRKTFTGFPEFKSILKTFCSWGSAEVLLLTGG